MHQARGLMPHLANVEMRIVRVLATMEHTGMAVSRTKLTAMQVPLKNRIDLLEKRAHSMAGKAFSLTAPDQVSNCSQL